MPNEACGQKLPTPWLAGIVETIGKDGAGRQAGGFQRAIGEGGGRLRGRRRVEELEVLAGLVGGGCGRECSSGWAIDDVDRLLAAIVRRLRKAGRGGQAVDRAGERGGAGWRRVRLPGLPVRSARKGSQG